MPGLSFLSKKGFHTSNLKNVERVWAAEKKAGEEKSKLAEYQKQINEERQIQELRQLQVASGQVVKTVDTTLDWMYEGPSAELHAQQSSEEYLLGKIYKPQENKSSHENGVLGMIDKRNEANSSQWMKKVTSKNDSFTRVHEDPILMIKQEEKKAMESVINNPLKMDRIKQRISLELQEKDSEKKRQKKERKKEKKAKKEEKKKKQRLQSENHELQMRETRSRSRSRSTSTSSSLSNRNLPEDSHRRREDASNSQQYGLLKRKYNDHDAHSSQRDKEDDRRNRQSPRGSNPNLGPSEELLHRRQEKEQQEVAARQALRNGRQDVKRLSEQEREQRLQQMQTDADVADRSRARRVGGTSGNGGGDGDRVKNKGIGDDNDRGSSADMSKKNAAFLGDLRTEAYVQSYERGIQERLHQNRHYAQRSVDLNSDGFMRK